MSKPLGLGVKVFSASLGVFIPKCFHNKLFRGFGAGFALRTPRPLAGLQAGGTGVGDSQLDSGTATQAGGGLGGRVASPEEQRGGALHPRHSSQSVS